MKKLQNHIAPIFNYKDYENLSSKGKTLFLSINENISDPIFRKMCFDACEGRCLITQEYIDLNKNEYNTDKNHPKYGSWMSIEHIKAQSININSNYIGNFIPIKGNLNSSIGVLDTIQYITEVLGWDEIRIEKYYARIEKFRQNLFFLFKDYYKNSVFLKYNKNTILDVLNEYKYSSYTNKTKTYDEIAKKLNIQTLNAKKTIKKIASEFGIEIIKLTKTEACFELEINDIYNMLVAGIPIKDISQKYRVKYDQIKKLILEHPDLGELSAVIVNENRVIKICEKNENDMIDMYNKTQNINEILKKYNLHRDHGTVKMFIHMAINKRALEEELEKLRKINKRYDSFDELLNIVDMYDIEIIKLQKDMIKKQMKIKIKFNEL